jgi:hypothetical protein
MHSSSRTSQNVDCGTDPFGQMAAGGVILGEPDECGDVARRRQVASIARSPIFIGERFQRRRQPQRGFDESNGAAHSIWHRVRQFRTAQHIH